MKKFKRAIYLLALTSMVAMSGCGGSGGGSSTTAVSDSGSSTGTAPSAGNPAATPAVNGVAKMAWDAANDGDGAAVAGYKVCYGKVSGEYTNAVDVGSATSCTIDNLAPGRYYFAVTAYDSAGSESNFSNEVVKDI